MFKKLTITGMLLLLMLSLIPQALAQGAASGKSISAFERGLAPVTPATRVPGLSTGRLSYWELAGLGREPLGLGRLPPAVTPAGMPYNPFSAFGPYGLFDQYSIYGPYGMYGPAGPGYGSGLGFYGFARNDPWMLVKQYNEQQALLAAGPPKAAVPASAGKVPVPAGATAPAGRTTPTSASAPAPGY